MDTAEYGHHNRIAIKDRPKAPEQGWSLCLFPRILEYTAIHPAPQDLGPVDMAAHHISRNKTHGHGRYAVYTREKHT